MKFRKTILDKKLIIFILIILLVTIFFLFKNQLLTLNWQVFVSYKVPLSFRYPKNIPLVNNCDPFMLNYRKIEEEIIFDNTCEFDQKKEVLGRITVKKVGNIKDPQQYLNDELTFPGHQFELKTNKIGDSKGYLLINNENSNIKNYYVFANNLEYKISLGKLSEPLTPKLEKAFNTILSTFKF